MEHLSRPYLHGRGITGRSVTVGNQMRAGLTDVRGLGGGHFLHLRGNTLKCDCGREKTAPKADRTSGIKRLEYEMRILSK